VSGPEKRSSCCWVRGRCESYSHESRVEGGPVKADSAVGETKSMKVIVIGAVLRMALK